MGTNYYFSKEAACPTCGHDRGDLLHIGKSSAGWCFSLHVIPDSGLNSLEDWEHLFPDGYIRDEYGQHISPAGMSDVIRNRGRARKPERPLGYESWDDFHRVNQSEPGPKGLLRHRLGTHCVGHGEGTWDLIPGEFS
jgi:hypothetical protein